MFYARVFSAQALSVTRLRTQTGQLTFRRQGGNIDS